MFLKYICVTSSPSTKYDPLCVRGCVYILYYDVIITAPNITCYWSCDGLQIQYTFLSFEYHTRWGESGVTLVDVACIRCNKFCFLGMCHLVDSVHCVHSCGIHKPWIFVGLSENSVDCFIYIRQSSWKRVNIN